MGAKPTKIRREVNVPTTTEVERGHSFGRNANLGKLLRKHSLYIRFLNKVSKILSLLHNDKVGGDKVGSDKVGGDKVGGDKIGKYLNTCNRCLSRDNQRPTHPCRNDDIIYSIVYIYPPSNTEPENLIKDFLHG